MKPRQQNRVSAALLAQHGLECGSHDLGAMWDNGGTTPSVQACGRTCAGSAVRRPNSAIDTLSSPPSGKALCTPLCLALALPCVCACACLFYKRRIAVINKTFPFVCVPLARPLFHSARVLIPLPDHMTGRGGMRQSERIQNRDSVFCCFL
jgi:hypothetical protein